MQSPRAGLFSRVSHGFGFGKTTKSNQRDSAPTSATSEEVLHQQPRRPPVGGGRHDDDEDVFPAAQTQQPSLVQREEQAQVQEGTEGFKAVGSQPASQFSEIQPASSSEDVSGQTIFATPYKNTAITKLMGETSGPSTTVAASTESSSSQAPYTPSPVREQQPQVSHPAEQAAHRSGSSLTTERVQGVAGVDKSSQAAPVQGQNMATGGFRSSSGVPSEDELNQLYSNEDGAQGGAGQVSKVDTDGGDLPDDLNIGFSGKGPGLYGSFATGKPATRGPTASQAEQAGQGQGSVQSMMQLPESEEFRTHHKPEGVGSIQAAPFVAPMSQGEKPLLEKAQPETRAQAVAATEGHTSANPPAQLEGPQQTAAPDQHPPHAEVAPQSGTPPPQQHASETAFVSKQLAEPQLSPAELGVPSTTLPQHDIPPIFEPEHYTPQYSSRPKFDAPSTDVDTLPQPEITPFEPRSAPLTKVTSQQLTQHVGGSGGNHEAALGVQTGRQEEVPFGSRQPASLEGQEEREAVPTEGHGSHQGYGSNAAGSNTGSSIGGGIASYIPGTEANREARAEQGKNPDTFNSGGGVASYIPGTEANRISRAEQGSSAGSNTAAGLASYIPGTQANQDSKAAAGQDSSTHTSSKDNTGGGLLGGLMSYIPGTEANKESHSATGQDSTTHNSGSGNAESGAVSYSDQQKPAGQGTQVLAQGSEQYPATPERLNRQPHPASPEDVQASAPSGAAVTRESEYNAPAHTGEQEAPLSGSRGFTDIPNYPRENPLFDEEQQQQQQQQEEAEPEAAPKFYENPEFETSGRSGQQSLGSPMVPNTNSPQQQQTHDSPAYTELQNQPQTAHMDSQGPAHSTAGRTSSVEIPPESDQEHRRYGQPYESSDMHRALSGPRPVASEDFTAANNAAGQEVLANSAVEPEAETLSNTAEDGHIGGDSAAFEQSGTSVGRVTSRPQLGGAVQEVVPQQAVEQQTVAEPVVEVEAVKTAPPVAVEQEMIVKERVLPTTYSGPQIVSKEADLTPLPPSAAWGPATIHAPYTAPTRAAAYVPPTQESVIVAQPVVETDTVMVEQDPPIDPSVERAEPALPVSTRTTGMLTSTPQLGPATIAAATTTAVTTEISPVTQETTVTQGVPLPTPMTREEITSYRPAQDPTIDPSQGQAPVQVSTNLAVEPRPPSRAPVMSTAEIAAYRSGEDPAYDPVERRGWWEVDMAQGGGTILPATTRGPSRGRRGTTGTRGAGPPVLTGPHIHPGGNPSQATHFGSILPGARSGAVRGRGMGQTDGAPGLYDAPPLGGRYASGAPLTPTPTPVAPLGDGETRDVPTAVKGLGQDPVYDPTEGASGSALPSAGNDQIDNPLFEEQQQDISGTAYDQVESAPGLQKDVTHRGEQVGTPHFARQQQQQPSAFGAAPPGDVIVTRPVMGSSRRPPRTVNLADIGRPAPLPPVQEQQYEVPEHKPEFALGGADILPRDEHYVKPTPYDELGPNARSALSGAGWKTKWAVEMEATGQRGGQALKYPVGPVVPKGASGFAPKASTAIVGEPDYAALARGEPGLTVPGTELQDNLPLGPPGGPSAASGGVAPQPSYMQTAAPPVHPGAPVVDRGFTGPGGAAGGARRRLASKLFDRQHSLQDPSFDPVSQRFGRDEGYGVELPVHRPPQVPTSRAPAGLGSDQGVVGGPSRVRQPQYEEEEIIPEEQEIQEEAVAVVGKTNEMNERLLVEVRKRLQAAKSQLNSASPSEADAGTPVDSPLGGRPTVLQNRTSEGSPGYWRTLEEVEAEGSNPMSRNAPSPWVQTHGPELVPRKLFQAGEASTGIGGAPRMRTGMISSGKVANKGLEGYGSGRVHNIAGGYSNHVSRGGNQYSWGRQGVF
ncbi:hypothetical protein WJX77_001053 [Trebouxia sp. C0004]